MVIRVQAPPHTLADGSAPAAGSTPTAGTTLTAGSTRASDSPGYPLGQPYWWPLPPLAGPPAPLQTLVQGEVVETAHGCFFLRRTIFRADAYYGACCVADFLRLNAESAAALARAPELGQVSPERILFLDTETTGLAGGTGTYAFMVGLGSFQEVDGETAFVVEQSLMRTYGEERAMFSWLAERLEAFDALATFNGRGFDVPLLQTRFLMCRARLDLEEWPHLDLLPPSRRLWRLAVQSCALQHLERHILGVGREDDVESFLIPAIYHQFVRDGDARYLARVFNHNQADILAMVALAIRACAAFEMAAGDDGAAGGTQLSPEEYVGLGRIYEQLERLEAAERAYRKAREGRATRELVGRATMALAALLKRTRRHDEAAALWQTLADGSPAHSVPALIELAKYWEHRRRDPARAFALAEQARVRWLAALPAAERPLPTLGRWPAVAAVVAPDDFERRLERLARKRERPLPSARSRAVSGG